MNFLKFSKKTKSLLLYSVKIAYVRPIKIISIRLLKAKYVGDFRNFLEM